jgi:hypothetical protein
MAPAPLCLGLTPTYPEDHEQTNGSWRVDDLVGLIVYTKRSCFFFDLILSGYGFPTASVPGECTLNRASSQNTAKKIQQRAFVIPYASA